MSLFSIQKLLLERLKIIGGAPVNYFNETDMKYITFDWKGVQGFIFEKEIGVEIRIGSYWGGKASLTVNCLEEVPEKILGFIEGFVTGKLPEGADWVNETDLQEK